jgi:hypothetical protein
MADLAVVLAAIRGSGVCLAEQKFLRRQAVEHAMRHPAAECFGVLGQFEEVMSVAASALGLPSAGIGRVKSELSARGFPMLAKAVAQLNQARRWAAHPWAGLAASVSNALLAPVAGTSPVAQKGVDQMVFGPQLFDLFSVGSAPGVDDGDGDEGSEGQSSQFGDSSLGGEAAGGVASCDENVVIDTFLRLVEGSADRAVLDGRFPDVEAMSEAVSAVSHAFGSADAAAGPAEVVLDGYGCDASGGQVEEVSLFWASPDVAVECDGAVGKLPCGADEGFEMQELPAQVPALACLEAVTAVEQAPVVDRACCKLAVVPVIASSGGSSAHGDCYDNGVCGADEGFEVQMLRVEVPALACFEGGAVDLAVGEHEDPPKLPCGADEGFEMQELPAQVPALACLEAVTAVEQAPVDRACCKLAVVPVIVSSGGPTAHGDCYVDGVCGADEGFEMQELRVEVPALACLVDGAVDLADQKWGGTVSTQLSTSAEEEAEQGRAWQEGGVAEYFIGASPNLPPKSPTDTDQQSYCGEDCLITEDDQVVWWADEDEDAEPAASASATAPPQNRPPWCDLVDDEEIFENPKEEFRMKKGGGRSMGARRRRRLAAALAAAPPPTSSSAPEGATSDKATNTVRRILNDLQLIELVCDWDCSTRLEVVHDLKQQLIDSLAEFSEGAGVRLLALFDLLASKVALAVDSA